jgi:hypothetical protein
VQQRVGEAADAVLAGIAAAAALRLTTHRRRARLEIWNAVRGFGRYARVGEADRAG